LNWPARKEKDQARNNLAGGVLAGHSNAQVSIGLREIMSLRDLQRVVE
jgi:hypothetical protein